MPCCRRAAHHVALAARHLHQVVLEQERSNIEFHVQPLSLDKFGEPLASLSGDHGERLQSAPTSRGTIRLRSADPSAKPMIAPNYLATPEDRSVAADAIRVTRRLMRQPALQAYHPEEYLPGPGVGDGDASLAKAAGDIGTTIFHPDRHGQDGAAVRSDRRGRRAAARRSASRAARDRCVGDADHHLGQHQHPDHHDRRQGGR